MAEVPLYTEDNAPREGWREYHKTATAHAVRIDHDFRVATLEGEMRGRAGDYLMRGAHGELYICAAEIFATTYAPADPASCTGP